MRPRPQAITARILEGLIAGGVALVVLVQMTGGFTIDAWAFTIRARDWVRPLVGVLILSGLYVARAVRTARQQGWSALDPTAPARVVLGTVTAVGLAYWAAYFDPYCGGSDSATLRAKSGASRL